MEVSKKVIDMSYITDIDLYINSEYPKDQPKIDEKSLTNISWIESVEEELSSSINNKSFNLSNSGKNINKIFDIDSIIVEKYDKLSDIIILEYETIIIHHLKKIIKNDINIDNLLLMLDWLLGATEYLSNKIGTFVFKHKISDKNILVRSSYKFCNYNFECQYNYNIQHSGCYAQHYVHNLVNADLDALKQYIVFHITTLNDLKIIDEITKSINTISFVIAHMYDELKKAEQFNFFNIANNHIQRIPKKKKCSLLKNTK